MTLLSASRVGFEHPAQPIRLFSDVTFDIHPGDRIALVGPNGAGKSTLLKLLTAELTPNTGAIVRRKDLEIACVAQERHGPANTPLEDHVLAARADLAALRAAMRELEPRLADEAAAVAYAELIDRYGEQDGYAFEAECERVLEGLRFSAEERTLPLGALSAGQRMRAELARVLLAPAPLLLLDEPTNHLDIEAREWLEGYLHTLDAACVMVSHDRRFLSRTARRTFELRRGALTVYEGDYDFYREQRAIAERHAWEAYEGQQRRFEAARRAAEQRLSLARQVAETPQGQGIRECKDFYRAKAARVAKTAKVIMARPMREAPAEKPRLDAPIPQLDFAHVDRASDVVLHAEALTMRYGEIALFENLDLMLYRGERLALVGPNGAGKSTLLRLLLGEAPSAGAIRWGSRVRVGHFAQEGENLDLSLSPVGLCREVHPDATHIRTILGCLRLRADEADRPLGTMSAGERAKVAIARLLLSGANVLLLDEPTNHLDLDTREALEATLAQYPGTIVFVSHDRYFIDMLADRVLELGR